MTKKTLLSRLRTFLKVKFRRIPQKKKYHTLLFAFIFLGFFLWGYHKPPYPSHGYHSQTIPTQTILKACELKKVIDGDTLEILCPYQESYRSLRLRVWGIDAPETGQKPWGEEATLHLTSLIQAPRNLTVEIKDIDRYSRYVAKIYQGEPRDKNDLGLKMVEEGYAIVYHTYNDDPTYKKIEANAKKRKQGLWKEEGPQQNPAKWRRLNR